MAEDLKQLQRRLQRAEAELVRAERRVQAIADRRSRLEAELGALTADGSTGTRLARFIGTGSTGTGHHEKRQALEREVRDLEALEAAAREAVVSPAEGAVLEARAAISRREYGQILDEAEQAKRAVAQAATLLAQETGKMGRLREQAAAKAAEAEHLNATLRARGRPRVTRPAEA